MKNRKITVYVPKGEQVIYLEEVINQLAAGFTSGYVDRDTNWKIEEIA